MLLCVCVFVRFGLLALSFTFTGNLRFIRLLCYGVGATEKKRIIANVSEKKERRNDEEKKNTKVCCSLAFRLGVYLMSQSSMFRTHCVCFCGDTSTARGDYYGCYALCTAQLLSFFRLPLFTIFFFFCHLCGPRNICGLSTIALCLCTHSTHTHTYRCWIRETFD